MPYTTVQSVTLWLKALVAHILDIRFARASPRAIASHTEDQLGKCHLLAIAGNA
ncbi:MAG: hypothetical protein NWQ28_14160 [Nodularia sp. (in: cyanobacteria)]|nr:hypothetical protein [Nodularia sp. (in: cyanobacteria)]